MKLGLALGGGGSKGSYQLGVLRALIEENLLKDLIAVSGTSIGSMNASFIMANYSYEKMFEIWSSINNQVLYKNGLNRFKKDRLGLFDQKIMYDILCSFQNKEVIQKSKIKGFAVASKINNYSITKQMKKDQMEKKVFNLNESEDPHKIILASSSVPIVFGPTKIDDDYYVDGGIFDNLPVSILLEEKIDTIITIALNPNNDLSVYNLESDKLIIDFSPKEKLVRTVIGMLIFKKEVMEERIELGYSNAKLKIEELKQKGVIIDGKWNDTIKGIY